MIKDLPYPYTSKAQYERSLQTPVGTEWNTRLGFQRGTLPRVVKKVCSLESYFPKKFHSHDLLAWCCYRTPGEDAVGN